jgi:hypothetical protein
LATLPHDEDADKRSTQHSAYDQIALQRVRLIRTRLGCQSSGIVLGVHVVLQQLLQLHGRASLACRLQQTKINHWHNHHHAR